MLIAAAIVVVGANVPPSRRPPVASAASTPSPSPAASPAPFAAYPRFDEDRCYLAKDHDAADLCAQWRAAMAAERSAHESRRATNWVIASVLFSFLTLIGLVISLWQTLGARRETARALAAADRSAAAAMKHADLAEKAAQAQLRAYIVIDSIQTTVADPDYILVSISLRNAGVTPARIRKSEAAIWLAHWDNLDPAKTGPAAKADLHVRRWLPQNNIDNILRSNSEESEIAKLNEKDMWGVFVYGRVEYEDVFGVQQWMSFAYTNEGHAFDKECRFRPCIYGNDGN